MKNDSKEKHKQERTKKKCGVVRPRAWIDEAIEKDNEEE